MNTTSNNSGAEEAERYFNEHYRDKDGKVLWDKLRKDIWEAVKDSEPMPPPEWLIRLRASKPDQKEKDDAKDDNPA